MPRRKNPQTNARLIAILLFLLVAGVIALLVACPPSTPRLTVTPTTGVASGIPEKPNSILPAQPVVVGAGPSQRSAAFPIHPQPEKQALLAVIIDDAGYSLSELDEFLSLPGPFTVAVLPNLAHSTAAAQRVLAAGKDLILHCPMQPEGPEDPGPGALYTGQSASQVDELLDAMFASVPGAMGMNNHMGSKATADETLMTEVLSYLKRHGKFFVDSRTTANTVAPRVAAVLQMPILQRNAFLDDNPTETDVAAAFDKGLVEARDKGTAIVIGHVQNKVMADILRARTGELAAQGIRLARLSDVMKERETESAR
jgi:polysaccharide deacetylase 2 family uncharacterized protein YibQ